MTAIVYQVVEHDGGWAYRLGDVFSETFPTHDAARQAADRAASEQRVPGETTTIRWQDQDGNWHDETARGSDRPDTAVRG